MLDLVDADEHTWRAVFLPLVMRGIGGFFWFVVVKGRVDEGHERDGDEGRDQSHDDHDGEGALGYYLGVVA